MTETIENARVLIVDDVPSSQRLLTAYLVSAGYEVLAAAAGAEALDRLEARSADLVLIDMGVEQQSGYEVCRQIKADRRTAKIPVIMVTDADSIEERIKADEAGTDDLVVKPIRRTELLLRIRSLLRIKLLRDRLSETVAELDQIRARQHEEEPVAEAVPQLVKAQS